MFTTQLALIDHIKNAGAGFKSVKAYAGEVKEDNAAKLRDILPAAFAAFIKGAPTMQDYQAFDVLVVTESKSFNKVLSLENNLELSQTLGLYLDDKAVFGFGDYDYMIDRDTLEAERFFQDDRFTIIAIHLQIKRL